MATTMTKRKAPAAREAVTVGVRMTREYQDWLNQVARKDRSNIATLFDRAVVAYAQQIGIDAPAPERVL
jgi:hypothetical protein